LRHDLAKGGKDAKSFFTGVCIRSDQQPGGPVSKDTLHDDVISIHGYPPYGQRYLFASAAWIANASIDDIANTMGNLPATASKFYQEATELQKTARANKAMAALRIRSGYVSKTRLRPS
jgi:hypothetical protein